MAIGLFCGLLGFKFMSRLTQGTSVMLVGGNPSFIIGCVGTMGSVGSLPRSVGIDDQGPDITHTSSEEDPDSAMWASYGMPIDLLEGEFEISNLLGVGVQFLTSMLRMGAGDRAKIETFLTRDLVRIVSSSFQHFTNFGTEEIDTDGGRVNHRVQGTSYEHEAWGAQKEKDKKGEIGDNDTVKPDSVAETGRWRFSQFKGFLGDFMQFFIMDPETAIGQMAQRNAGKSRVSFHSDGSILFQSVADIALERVTRVLVPFEEKGSHDPEGNTAEEIRKLDEKFLKLWPFDMKDAYKSPYQLREYARWLSTYHSFARFHRQNKDWKVPTESESPEPSWQNQEEDRMQADSTKYFETYACYRIMRDGSLVSLAGDGSAVVHSAGNIQISAPKNMTLEAGGDMRIIVGGNLYIKAKKNIEIASIFGGFITKSRTLWRALVEKGTMYFKSDASPADDGVGDPNPLQEVIDEQGIIFDAPNAGIKIVGKDDVLVMSEKGNVDIKAATEHVRFYAKNNIEMLFEHGHLAMKGLRMFASFRDCVALDCQLLDVSNSLTWSRAGLQVNTIRAKTVSATLSVYGPDRGPITPPDSTTGVAAHFNHISSIPEDSMDDFEPVFGEKTDDLCSAISEMIENAPPFEKDVKWQLYDQSNYIKKGETYGLFQSLSQQRLSSEAESDPDHEVETWVWASDDRLKPAPRTAKMIAPFPGKANQHMVHTTNVPRLDQLCGIPAAELSKRSDLKPAPVTFYTFK